MKEIKHAIKSSKSGKSPSDDLLLNEMLKCSMNHILPVLTKLFNLIWNAQHFLNLWYIAYQIPLFKDGDCSDPNNFTSISITSCLGKILTKVSTIDFNTKLKEIKS